MTNRVVFFAALLLAGCGSAPPVDFSASAGEASASGSGGSQDGVGGASVVVTGNGGKAAERRLVLPLGGSGGAETVNASGGAPEADSGAGGAVAAAGETGSGGASGCQPGCAVFDSTQCLCCGSRGPAQCDGHGNCHCPVDTSTGGASGAGGDTGTGSATGGLNGCGPGQLRCSKGGPCEPATYENGCGSMLPYECARCGPGYSGCATEIGRCI